MSGTLAVSLNGTRVGTIINIPGDYNIFAFDPAYVADPERPVLSQGLIDKNEDLIRVIPRTHTRSPPFFANLLPERDTLLRRIVAQQRGIKALAQDFPFLRSLGHDLPGAVFIEGIGMGDEPLSGDENDSNGSAQIRFSLAGMQLKFSARMANERFSIDDHLAGETWIVKMPTNAYSQLPENEFTIMSLATAVELDVPAIELRSLNSIPDALPYITALRSDEDKVFAIKRFDRGVGVQRIHAEDFNQVAAQKPEDKYENKSSSYIASVISQLCEPADLDEFVRRLIFGICVGNDDMHLKNWALIYPDGRHPKIAPMYDFVFTRMYLPDGALALTVGGKRRFGDMTLDALRSFARQSEISEKRVCVLADEMVEKIRSAWRQIKVTISNERLLTGLESHFGQVPLMNGKQGNFSGRSPAPARRLSRG